MNEVSVGILREKIIKTDAVLQLIGAKDDEIGKLKKHFQKLLVKYHEKAKQLEETKKTLSDQVLHSENIKSAMEKLQAQLNNVQSDYYASQRSYSELLLKYQHLAEKDDKLLNEEEKKEKEIQKKCDSMSKKIKHLQAKLNKKDEEIKKLEKGLLENDIDKPEKTDKMEDDLISYNLENIRLQGMVNDLQKKLVIQRTAEKELQETASENKLSRLKEENIKTSQLREEVKILKNKINVLTLENSLITSTTFNEEHTSENLSKENTKAQKNNQTLRRSKRINKGVKDLDLSKSDESQTNKSFTLRDTSKSLDKSIEESHEIKRYTVTEVESKNVIVEKTNMQDRQENLLNKTTDTLKSVPMLILEEIVLENKKKPANCSVQTQRRRSRCDSNQKGVDCELKSLENSFEETNFTEVPIWSEKCVEQSSDQDDLEEKSIVVQDASSSRQKNRIVHQKFVPTVERKVELSSKSEGDIIKSNKPKVDAQQILDTSSKTEASYTELTSNEKNMEIKNITAHTPIAPIIVNSTNHILDIGKNAYEPSSTQYRQDILHNQNTIISNSVPIIVAEDMELENKFKPDDYCVHIVKKKYQSPTPQKDLDENIQSAVTSLEETNYTELSKCSNVMGKLSDQSDLDENEGVVQAVTCSRQNFRITHDKSITNLERELALSSESEIETFKSKDKFSKNIVGAIKSHSNLSEVTVKIESSKVEVKPIIKNSSLERETNKLDILVSSTKAVNESLKSFEGSLEDTNFTIPLIWPERCIDKLIDESDLESKGTTVQNISILSNNHRMPSQNITVNSGKELVLSSDSDFLVACQKSSEKIMLNIEKKQISTNIMLEDKSAKLCYDSCDSVSSDFMYEIINEMKDIPRLCSPLIEFDETLDNPINVVFKESDLELKDTILKHDKRHAVAKTDIKINQLVEDPILEQKKEINIITCLKESSQSKPKCDIISNIVLKNNGIQEISEVEDPLKDRQFVQLLNCDNYSTTEKFNSDHSFSTKNEVEIGVNSDHDISNIYCANKEQISCTPKSNAANETQVGDSNSCQQDEHILPKLEKSDLDTLETEANKNSIPKKIVTASSKNEESEKLSLNINKKSSQRCNLSDKENTSEIKSTNNLKEIKIEIKTSLSSPRNAKNIDGNQLTKTENNGKKSCESSINLSNIQDFIHVDSSANLLVSSENKERPSYRNSEESDWICSESENDQLSRGPKEINTHKRWIFPSTEGTIENIKKINFEAENVHPDQTSSNDDYAISDAEGISERNNSIKDILVNQMSKCTSYNSHNINSVKSDSENLLGFEKTLKSLDKTEKDHRKTLSKTCSGRVKKPSSNVNQDITIASLKKYQEAITKRVLRMVLKELGESNLKLFNQNKRDIILEGSKNYEKLPNKRRSKRDYSLTESEYDTCCSEQERTNLLNRMKKNKELILLRSKEKQRLKKLNKYSQSSSEDRVESNCLKLKTTCGKKSGSDDMKTGKNKKFTNSNCNNMDGECGTKAKETLPEYKFASDKSKKNSSKRMKKENFNSCLLIESINTSNVEDKMVENKETSLTKAFNLKNNDSNLMKQNKTTINDTLDSFKVNENISDKNESLKGTLHGLTVKEDILEKLKMKQISQFCAESGDLMEILTKQYGVVEGNTAERDQKSIDSGFIFSETDTCDTISTRASLYKTSTNDDFLKMITEKNLFGTLSDLSGAESSEPVVEIKLKENKKSKLGSRKKEVKNFYLEPKLTVEKSVKYHELFGSNSEASDEEIELIQKEEISKACQNSRQSERIKNRKLNKSRELSINNSAKEEMFMKDILEDKKIQRRVNERASKPTSKDNMTKSKVQNMIEKITSIVETPQKQKRRQIDTLTPVKNKKICLEKSDENIKSPILNSCVVSSPVTPTNTTLNKKNLVSSDNKLLFSEELLEKRRLAAEKFKNFSAEKLKKSATKMHVVEKKSYKRPSESKRIKEILTPMSPDHETEYPPDLRLEPVAIPLNKAKKMNLTKANKLLDELLQFPTEKTVLSKVITEFEKQEVSHIAYMILTKISMHINEKLNLTYTPPSPPLTETQQVLLGLLNSLENLGMEGLLNSVIEEAEKKLLFLDELEMVDPVARIYTALCMIKKQIYRVRRFCCDMFYFMGNLAIPCMYTILSCWFDILPFEDSTSCTHLTKVIVHVILTRNFEGGGYNLKNLKALLTDYYNYKLDDYIFGRTLLKNLIDEYTTYPTTSIKLAVVIMCKNHDPNWFLAEFYNVFKPAILAADENKKRILINILGTIVQKTHFKNNKEIVNCLQPFLNMTTNL